MKLASRIYTVLLFIFLYAPLAVMAFFSFNAGSSTGKFTGFSLQWYAELFKDVATLDALKNSLIIAVLSSLIATVIGTAAAVGIQNMRRWQQNAINQVTNVPMMNPDIVTGVSMLLLFAFVGVMLGNRQILGFWTLLIAHITFNLPYVILSVQPTLRRVDTHLSEAAQDLGCTPLSAFFKVILPSIMPGIITGLITAFTLSIDDFVISYFTSGTGFQTLPLRIYSMTKRKVKPDINALSTLMFLAVLVLLIIINWRQAKEEKKISSKGV